jgi:DNA-binding winged helix-turn-helix (wHTH) protein
MARSEDLPSSELISFGPFRFFPAQRYLEKAGTPVQLRGFPLDILIALVSRPGKLVTKKELLDQVWPEMTVGEGSLRAHVSALRRALDDGQKGARYVANIPGRGYCFVAPLSRTPASDGMTPLDGVDGLPHNLPPEQDGSSVAMQQFRRRRSNCWTSVWLRSSDRAESEKPR